MGDSFLFKGSPFMFQSDSGWTGRRMDAMLAQEHGEEEMFPWRREEKERMCPKREGGAERKNANGHGTGDPGHTWAFKSLTTQGDYNAGRLG